MSYPFQDPRLKRVFRKGTKTTKEIRWCITVNRDLQYNSMAVLSFSSFFFLFCYIRGIRVAKGKDAISCVRTLKVGGRVKTFKKFPRGIPKDRKGYFSGMCVLWEMLIAFSRDISNYATLCKKRTEKSSLSPSDTMRCYFDHHICATLYLWKQNIVFILYYVVLKGHIYVEVFNNILLFTSMLCILHW